MAKLSNYQQKVLEEAKRKIDLARSCANVYEYAKADRGGIREDVVENLDDNPKWLKHYTKWYNLHKDGVVLVNSNIRTLQKLEQLGIIEIVEVDKYRQCHNVLDHIKILNY